MRGGSRGTRGGQVDHVAAGLGIVEFDRSQLAYVRRNRVQAELGEQFGVSQPGSRQSRVSAGEE